MSQPRWSAAEKSAMEASHGALINQVLKSRIDKSPPSSLSRSDKSLSSNRSRFEVDIWALRGFFNRLKLVDRAFEDNYTASWKAWDPTPQSVLDDLKCDEAYSVILRFEAADGCIAFDAHAHLSPEREIITRTKMLDPKHIYVMGDVHLTCLPEKAIAT